MRYFIDTEFIEEPNTIDLISIGIAAEDGREYHAISKEFDFYKAWRKSDGVIKYTNLPGDAGTNERPNYWLRENVLQPIHWYLSKLEMLHELNYQAWKDIVIKKGFYEGRRLQITLGELISKWGILKDQIAKEILEFVGYPDYKNGKPEFYGYYADYDWVVFCWLFGRMINLPKGFPMYCRDLKQMMDDRGLDKEWTKKNCPKSNVEHSAIEDAKWARQLHLKMMTNK